LSGELRSARFSTLRGCLGRRARRTVELVLLLQGSRRQRLGRAGEAHGLMSGRRPQRTPPGW
jgi:hypothetical protein